MCGIAGFFQASGTRPLPSDTADRMAAKIFHRGPDDAGSWADPESGIGLAHRRLSILDVSPSGHQPMRSCGGRFVIAFNGEIYNHSELRKDLSGISWRGHSDTETLLAAIEAWGIETALRRATGMFAFALWDRVSRTLILARDRLGEKPLYYGWSNGSLVFASELKALCTFPGWNGEIDRDAAARFMRFGYIPLPYSIYRGILKVIPGTFLSFSAQSGESAYPEPQTYWSAREVAAPRGGRGLSDADTIERLEYLLSDAVGQQMISDVPIGAFLSGGIDSSTVVALMQKQAPRAIKTFSIGFSEDDYDEARYAKAVAAHLGTDHTDLYVSAAEAREVIPSLPQIYDEPFGDSSGIPTYLVARLARQQVTVALSGDGGDELFGGYNRYVWGRSIWARTSGMSPLIKYGLGRAVLAISPATWDRIGRALPNRYRQPTFGDRLHKLAEVIDVESPDELYRRLVSQQRERESLIIGAREVPVWADTETASLERGDFTERMMFNDQVAYLTDDILVKVDRAAMSSSLETRVPMLDHRLVEFAWELPLNMKIRDGQGKWILRQVLNKYVPPKLFDRPKQGFGVPIDSWLRGPLRDWAETLLSESSMKKDGYLKTKIVRARWEEHLTGRRNWGHWLWNVLMFQSWHEKHLACIR
jgi:asparagine synthase (glutamine-hydrolysing)